MTTTAARYRLAPLLFSAVLGGGLAVAALGLRAAEKIVWKPLDGAILKIDEKPQKIWNVYRVDKKEPVLLVQIWRRFLMVNFRDRKIFDIDPAKLQHKDKDLLWDQAEKPEKPVPTEDWLVRDVGPLKRIRVKLSAEGRVLEVQIPIERDLRPFY